MLTIRREQMEILSAYMRQSFEDRMARHIAQFFPVPLTKLTSPPGGDPPVRILIRQGIARAASYEISSERDVKRFIELMVVMGPDFETSADASWAQAILDEKTIPARARLELIHQQLPDRIGESAATSAARAY